MTRVGIFNARARRMISVCVVALNHQIGGLVTKKKKGTSRGDSSHPKGSPTTSKETSSVPALYSISSLCVSTISRSARIKGFS